MMATSSSFGARDSAAHGSDEGFVRALGLFPATTVNMSQMVGIGPFITIPLMISAMGGPQALIGWVLGAVLAMADGLVWAELGAAMPAAGGSYVCAKPISTPRAASCHSSLSGPRCSLCP